MTIFFQVVLPVILVFFAGYALQKILHLEIKSISTVTLYIMLPCLVFKTFYEAEFNQSYLMMVIFSVLLLFSILALNKIAAKVFSFDTPTESGLILSTAFMNAGNYELLLSCSLLVMPASCIPCRLWFSSRSS